MNRIKGSCGIASERRPWLCAQESPQSSTAQTSPRALLALLLFVLVPLIAIAAAPQWWTELQVLDANATANDYAAINQGQLKNLAVKAYYHLQSNLPPSTWASSEGTNLYTLVHSFETNTVSPYNYNAVNLGQLKNVAKPFYDVLKLPSVSYATTYPWSGLESSANDYAMANIGQAKNLFSFDLTNIGQDEDQNGIPDTWEMRYFGYTSIALGEDPDGDGVNNSGEYTQGTDPTDYYNGTNPVISIVSGDNQQVGPNCFLAQPLTVLIASTTGTALTNAPVKFIVSSWGGQLAETNASDAALSDELTIHTDSQGYAQVWFRTPIPAGISSIVAMPVVSSGDPQSVQFSATILEINSDGNAFTDNWELQYFNQIGIDANADPDGDGINNLAECQQGSDPTDYYNGTMPTLVAISGDNQAGYAGSFMSQPLVVEVRNSQGIVMANAPVTLTVTQGDGALAQTNVGAPATESVLELRTDSAGRVQVWFKNGSTAGEGLVTVMAGNSEPTTFHLTTIENAPPEVQITQPLTDAMVLLGTTTTIEATATDADGTIAKVEFYSNETKLGEATTAPYQLQISLPSGDQAITAIATDDKGATTVSEAVTVHVLIDSDNNGIPDEWENKYFGQTGIDLEGHADNDGLNNYQEYLHGTDPTKDDSDGDGISDGQEVLNGTNPLDFYNGNSAAYKISVVSGDGQPILPGRVSLAPVTYAVLGPNDEPVENAPITCSTTEDGLDFCLSADGSNASRSLTIRTDSSGKARVYLKFAEQPTP